MGRTVVLFCFSNNKKYIVKNMCDTHTQTALAKETKCFSIGRDDDPLPHTQTHTQDPPSLRDDDDDVKITHTLFSRL